MKKVLSLFLALVLVLALCACGGSAPATTPAAQPAAQPETPSVAQPETPEAQGEPASDETFELLVAHNEPANGTSDKSLQAFLDNVGKATGGRVTYQDLPGGTLGDEAQALERIRSGAQDMAIISISNFAGQFPLAEIMTTPGLGIQNATQGTEAFWDYYDKYQEAIENEFGDIKLLVFWGGAANSLMFDRQVSSVADMKGLTIRAGAGATTTFCQNLGMNTVIMPPPDCYTAVQKNTIDGLLSGMVMVSAFNIQEVCKCFVQPGVSLSCLCVVMSRELWDSFPADIQAAFEAEGGRNASVNLFAAGSEADLKASMDILAGCDDCTIIQADDEMMAAFEEASSGLHATWIENANAAGGDGEAMLNDFMTFVKNH